MIAPRYRAARGEERGRILEEFVASTGYHRKYALSLLNHPITKGSIRKKRTRPRQYVFALQQALVMCWRAANDICSKRLVPYLPVVVVGPGTARGTAPGGADEGALAGAESRYG